MNTTVLRTHEYVKELVDTGFTEKQAETIVRQHVEIASEHIATKQDLELLEKKLIIKLGAMVIGSPIFMAGIALAVLLLILK